MSDYTSKISELNSLVTGNLAGEIPLSLTLSSGTLATNKITLSQLRDLFDFDSAYSTVEEGIAATVENQMFYVYVDNNKLSVNEYVRTNIGANAVIGKSGTKKTIYIPALLKHVKIQVESFAALREFKPWWEGQVVYLKGYYEGSTTGGGDFVGHLGTATDDGGTVASGAGFYWERNYEFATVEMFGAVGNNEVDDSSAWGAALLWLSKESCRTLRTGKGTQYKINKNLTLHYQTGIIGCSLIMSGVFHPTNDVTKLLSIYNAISGIYEIKVLGDGAIDNPSIIPDYSVADPVGGVEAFIIDNSRNNSFSIWGFAYPGRVLRTKSTGSLKTSNNIFRLRTGDTTVAMENGKCGQACYLQGGSDAFGIIESSRTAWDVYGSVLEKIADIRINSWEADGATTGSVLKFSQVSSAHIGTLSLGSQNLNSPVFLFTDYDSSSPASKVNIERIFTVNGSVGIAIVGITANNTQRVPLHIGSAFTYSQSIGLLINNISNVEIDNLVTDFTTDCAIVFDGMCRNIRVNGGFLMNPPNAAIRTTSSANINYCYITIRSRMATNLKNIVDFSLGTVGSVTFNDCYFNSDYGYVFNLQNNNNVIIRGGNYTGSSGIFASDRSAVIKDTSNPIIEARGSSNFPAETVSGATLKINHGLNLTPTNVDLRWSQIPSPGSQLILTDTDAVSFTVTFLSSNPLSNQVNFRWFANSELR